MPFLADRTAKRRPADSSNCFLDAATCASYCAVAVISLLGGPLASRMGIKGMLIAGAATFAINGSGKFRPDIDIFWHILTKIPLQLTT